MRPEENERFLRDLSSDSPWEMIIRGHLWVESELIATLQDVLPFPEHVDLGRFLFPQKVALVTAHGFIRPLEVPAYLKLNALRNKIAHNVDTEPGQDDEQALVDSLGPYLRHMWFLIGKKQTAWPDRLRHVILAMCISLSVERERLADYRRQVAEANRRLRASAQRLVDAAQRRGLA